MIIKKHIFGELPSDTPKKILARLIKRVFKEEKNCAKFVTFQGKKF
jgi:hypothetical protein